MVFNWGKPKDGRLARKLLKRHEQAKNAAWSRFKQSDIARIRPQQLAKLAIRPVRKKYGIKGAVPIPFARLAYQLVLTSGAYPVNRYDVFPATTAERITLEEEIRWFEYLANNDREILKETVHTTSTMLLATANLVGKKYFEDPEGLAFEVPVSDVVSVPIDITSAVVKTLMLRKTSADPNGLFVGFLDRVESNALHQAGYTSETGWPKGKTLLSEIERQLRLPDPTYPLQSLYDGTPFERFFKSMTTVSLSETLRREHTHFIAPSGTGKTRALEFFINQDLVDVAVSKKSVFVVESEGTLTRRLARHPFFDTKHEDNIADRLFFIDPELEGCMPSFNFFRLFDEPFKMMTALKKERASNLTADLWNYVFRALIDAPLTANQSYIFSYLIKMLIWVEGATVDTLLECLREPDEAVRLSKKAPKEVADVFRSTYTQKRLAPRRAELHDRIDKFLVENSTFKKLVSGKTSNFNIIGAINRGSVILVNTNKNMLGTEGANAFSRFMVALLRINSFSRTEKDISCFCYFDEVQEFADEKLAELFQQARKRAIGVLVAHQELRQIPSAVQQTIKTNTQSKFCGNGDYDDLLTMSKNMGTSPAFLKSLQKYDDNLQNAYTEFGFWGRGVTANGAVRVRIPLGTLEKEGLCKNYPPGRWLPKKKKKDPPPSSKNNDKDNNVSPWTNKGDEGKKKSE